MRYITLFISCCVAWFLFPSAYAQQELIPTKDFFEQLKISHPDSSRKLRVASLNILGNKKTKTYIILREISFREGDSLSILKLDSVLEQSRRQVFNINLFSETIMIPTMVSPTELSVTYAVREKWYVYPTPQFQLADRNYNEWLKTYKGDLNRVVYGVKFAHYNFTGRGDQLRIFLLNGYSRNISFGYNSPYSNSKLSEGFRVSAGYTQNREIVYKTSSSNKLLQYKKEGFVRNNWYASISYQSRKGFFERNIFSLSYTFLHVDDSIVSSRYNPNYFGKQQSSIGFPDLSYTFLYTNVDHINYPLNGTQAGLTILKRGLGLSGGINMLSIDGAFVKYLSHFKNQLYSSIQLYGKVKLPFSQAYINQRALGYGESYLRGQEYYVIDGILSAVAKYSLKKKIISFNIPVPFIIRQLPNIPFTFFAKTYADLGYCYSEREYDGLLNNRLLYTGGFGIDILTLYGINISLEYSFNQLGENGLFLHGKGGF